MPTVPWHQTVWNKGGIPRQSFLSWLLVLNRYPTRDKMIGWGLATSPLCLLCNVQAKSRDHLFFDCFYTWEILSSLARRCACNLREIGTKCLINYNVRIAGLPLESSPSSVGNHVSTGLGRNVTLGSIGIHSVLLHL